MLVEDGAAAAVDHIVLDAVADAGKEDTAAVSYAFSNHVSCFDDIFGLGVADFGEQFIDCSLITFH